MSPKTIGLVAHDHRKADLIEWVRGHAALMLRHQFICTGTTGRILQDALAELAPASTDVPKVEILKSGPLGGDQQLGARIASGEVDMLVFLWDPMRPQPHDVDVKALLRIAVLYNVPTACNRSTADYMVASGLLESDYRPIQPDYEAYLDRRLPGSGI